jgi:murein DD-endopeptidase MepM/ murein hydrolase activator NlpD
MPYDFGDIRTYKYQDIELATVRQAGLDYIISAGERIPAVHSGKVTFSGLLGTRGNTLILDHGFGLSSVYSHLRNFDRVEGDSVKQGETIGTAGSTGLVDRPTLGFEFRLHGMPVRPAEWWDENWLKGHIEDKIQSTKKLLGIKIQNR